MSISQNFSTPKPTLTLDFARSKKLDPRITFTRSSGGTCVGPNGLITLVSADQPRFDHDPTTGVCNGLLIEESRTNLVTFSDDFANARWTRTGFTINTNTLDTFSPDGTNNSDKILETATTNFHSNSTFNAITITANTLYTASIFVKSINKRYVQLVFDDNSTTSGGFANFDLNVGSVVASGNYGTGYIDSSRITAYPNNWYKISITSTAGTTSTLARFALNGLSTNDLSVFPTYAGNTANGYYIYGAQVEQGFLTSYIPTTSATVTRSQDNASIVGTNFSSWYNPNQWTLFADMSTPSANLIAAAASAQYVSIDDGTSNNFYTIRCVTGPSTPYIDGYANYNGNPVADYTGSNGSSFPSRVKAALVAKDSDSAFCYNGNVVETDSAFTLASTVNRMVIGGSPKAGTISKILYYPVRLTNDQIDLLTT